MKKYALELDEKMLKTLLVAVNDSYYLQSLHEASGQISCDEAESREDAIDDLFDSIYEQTKNPSLLGLEWKDVVERM